MDTNIHDPKSDKELIKLGVWLQGEHRKGTISIFNNDVDSGALQEKLETEGYADVPLSEEGKYVRDVINDFLVQKIQNIVSQENYRANEPGLPDIFSYAEKKGQDITPAESGLITAFDNCFQEDFLKLLPSVPGSTIPLQPDRSGYGVIRVRERPVSGLHTDEDPIVTVTVPLGVVLRATPVFSNRHKDKFVILGSQSVSEPVTIKPEYKDNADIQPDIGRDDCARIVAGDGWVRNGITQGAVHGMPFPEEKVQELKENGSVVLEYREPRVCFLSKFVKQQHFATAAGREIL